MSCFCILKNLVFYVISGSRAQRARERVFISRSGSEGTELKVYKSAPKHILFLYFAKYSSFLRVLCVSSEAGER
jgi:hypothetical protein